MHLNFFRKMEPTIITIDGPAGAGKTTTAKEVAKRLNFNYCSSGNIYRAICYLALFHKIDLNDEDAIIELLKDNTIFYNEDITSHLRDRDVSLNVSTIAELPKVRAYVNQLLHLYAKRNNIVVEGRDMGSVVFPETPFKFFLTAEYSIRKQRRNGEAIENRDTKDKTRAIAPLVIPKDSLIINTDRATSSEIAERIVEKIMFCKKKNYLYDFAKIILPFFFKLYFRLSINGSCNIPDYGPFILASNHTSYLDPPLLGVSIKRKLHFVAKKELFFPIFGSLIRRLNALPADREGIKNKETIKKIVRILENGGAIVIFPEGRRKRKNEGEKRPEKGIGYLAYLSNKTIRTPIIPVKIIGADKALGCGEFFIKPKPIKVIIGKPIFPEELNLSDYQQTADIVMERIRSL